MQHAIDVCRGNVHTGRIPRYPTVARQCVQRGDRRVLGQGFDEGVFTPPASDNHYLHGVLLVVE